MHYINRNIIRYSYIKRTSFLNAKHPEVFILFIAEWVLTYISHSVKFHSFVSVLQITFVYPHTKGADKSLARPERKQATATEDFDVYILS